MQHEYFSKILNQENVSIEFLGCVDKNQIRTLDEKSLTNLYIRVYQFRKEILLKIFNASKQVKLTELPMTANEKTVLKNEIEQLINMAIEFQNLDLETSSAKLSFQKFEEIKKSMLKKDYLFSDEAIYSKYSKLKKEMKIVGEKMKNKEEKKKFYKPFIIINEN